MIRGQSGQTIGAQMVNATTGAAFTSAVTVYITIDGGVQAIGTVGAGVCTHEGNGYHTYAPSILETAGALIAFTFIGTGAIPQTIQVETILDLVAASNAVSAASTSALAVTARTFITGALNELGVLGDGDVATAEQGQLGLYHLNLMLDEWNADLELLPVEGRTLFTLTPGQHTYTIGPTGNFVAARPSQLRYMGVILPGSSYELPMGAPMSREDYRALVWKALTLDFPTRYTFEPTTPNATIEVWPVPTSAAQIAAYVQTILSQFATLSTAYTFPPGYARAIHYNLTLACARPFGKRSAVDGDLVGQAGRGKALLTSANRQPPPRLTTDPMGGGRRSGFDWTTGMPR